MEAFCLLTPKCEDSEALKWIAYDDNEISCWTFSKNKGNKHLLRISRYHSPESLFLSPHIPGVL